MGVLRESPWYQEILREGELRGELRGEARGEARGEIEGIISSIQNSLEAKFGSQGLELMPVISQISDLQRLQQILRSVVLANKIEEVQHIF